MLLIENIVAKPILEEMSKTKLPDGVLCRVSYPICDIGQKNANDRVYEDAVWDKVEAEKDLKEKLENRALFGHAEHPEQTQSNLEKTSHVIFEMWRADGQEWQKFDVLDTPTGRIVDCLHRAGCRVGCSTRAEGDLEEAEDEEGNSYQRVIAETYNYVTTDFTADPSTFGSIPYDLKRNIVTEVKKLLENKQAVDSEKEFGASVLEGMKCGDDGKCQHCGCCSVLKEKKVSAKAAAKLSKSVVHKCHGCGKMFDDVADVNTSNLCKKCAKKFGESKTVESSIKDGIIKEGVNVKYGGDDAKVEKIEENAVSLTVGTVNPTTVNVDGEASLSVSPEGLITILPLEVLSNLQQPSVEPEVPAEPEEVLQAEPGEEPTTDPGNTGFGLPAVDGEYDEVPFEAKVGASTKITKTALETLLRTDKGKVSQVIENIKFDENERIEGKVTKVEESGITIALDDGTVVDIEDPSSVNITVTAPAPALEIEPVVELPKEEELEAEPELDKLPPKEEFESKDLKEKLDPGNLLQDKDGVDWVVKEAGDGALVITQPGEPGTEKRIGWDEVGSHGFTKVSEAIEEDISRKEFLRKQIKKLKKEKKDFEQANQRKLGQVAKELEALEAEGSGVKKEAKVEEGLQTWVTRCTKCGWKEPNSDLQKCPECSAPTEQDWKFEAKVEEVEAEVSTGDRFNYQGKTWKVVKAGETESRVVCATGDMAVEKVEVIDNKLILKALGESEVEEATSVKKEDGWHVESPSGADLGGPYKSKIEADKRKKDTEFYAASKESKVDESISDRQVQAILHVLTSQPFEDFYKGELDDYIIGQKENEAEVTTIVSDLFRGIEAREGVKSGLKPTFKVESISTTVKEISDLRVKEASTRAERDKAIELIEELTNEKGQLGEAARKEKAFETKALVGKITKTLEAKELEVDALRAVLEEKVKLTAGMKKQLEETKANLSGDLKSLNESISVTEQKHQIEADALMEHLQKTTETHMANMEQWSGKQDAEKVKHQKELDKLTESHKEKIEVVKKEVANEVKEKTTKEFIKGFIKNRLSETNLIVDENSRALLEECMSIEEVDSFLDSILEASRRGALHAESLLSVHVKKQEIADPETSKARRMVGDVFDGMNR